jgi:hypothetical protein
MSACATVGGSPLLGKMPKSESHVIETQEVIFESPEFLGKCPKLGLFLQPFAPDSPLL